MQTDNELKIAIIDDIEKERLQIAEMAADILRQAQIPHSIDYYADGQSLLDDMCNGKRYSILLLDVMMDGLSGMDLARQLRKQQDKTDIIFVSSNRDMALCGYEVNAVRYLAKPVDPEKMKEALVCCHRNWQEKKEVLLPTSKGQHRTSFAEIQFVEAFDRGTRFALSDGIVETKLKFSEVEAMLPTSAFLTCHRAYMVNIAHVMRVRPCEFELYSGMLVPISKNRYYEINRKFMDLIAD